MAVVGRLFVAVALSDEVRHGLAAHLHSELEGKPIPGRPVVPENWHITLRFLGRTNDKEYDQLLHALDETDLGRRFRLRFSGLGAFPRPRRATVLWVGVERGADALTRTATLVEEAVSDAGWMPEERPFHPHLTVSRIRPHQDVTAVVDRVGAFALPMPVEEVVLYRSHLGRGPARYEAIERFPLAAS